MVITHIQSKGNSSLCSHGGKGSRKSKGWWHCTILVFVCKQNAGHSGPKPHKLSWPFWCLLGSAIAWILKHSVTFVTLQELCLCQPMWDKVREILVGTFTTRFCSCITSVELSSASLNWRRSSHPTPTSRCQKDQAPSGGRKGLEVTWEGQGRRHICI